MEENATTDGKFARGRITFACSWSFSTLMQNLHISILSVICGVARGMTLSRIVLLPQGISNLFKYLSLI